MKRILTVALGLGLVFGVAATSSALSPSDFPADVAAGGIADSRHNLGAYGVHFRADNSDGNGGTTEICVFCHTPHHGANHAPLWAKGTQSTSYTAYGTTVAGTFVADSDIGAATLACLSCHDGVNTIDTLVNAPGKGNDGSNNTNKVNFNWTFTEDSNTVKDIIGSTRLNIGTDLTNDHPISISYEINKASLRPTSTLLSDLHMTTSEFTAGDNNEGDSATTTANRWAVKGYINTGATIGDLLRTTDNRVECSSCHDPHFSNKTWDEVESTWGGEADGDGMFLRRVGGNSVSGVCRSCHNK